MFKGITRYCDFTDDCGDYSDETAATCYNFPFR